MKTLCFEIGERYCFEFDSGTTSDVIKSYVEMREIRKKKKHTTK
ncbi:Mobile element protein [Methanosarcina barkeri 3]|uniref:Mobile element protein n=1 Tax=Methanosarcina barkeri 3 TaxID=1434107 RepID=A0A0E3SMK7_METBA|nr:Mobile element protein [Methanosarcina barkeri 3]